MSDRAYAAYTTHELRDLVRKEAPEEGGENLVRLCLELIACRSTSRSCMPPSTVSKKCLPATRYW
jgi:hypothetical protein